MPKRSNNTPSDSSKRFLEFNGHEMCFLLVEDTWWIALKPICDALNVGWKHQHGRLKNDEFIGPASRVHRMQVGSDQPRNMVCLPEFYIYGWLFEINSSSPELKKYKWECHKILYEYFHGTITQRGKLLREKAEALFDMNDMIENHPDIMERRKEIKTINKKLRNMDKELASGQFSILFEN